MSFESPKERVRFTSFPRWELRWEVNFSAALNPRTWPSDQRIILNRSTLRILGILHCLVIGAAADISWNFEAPVVNPNALDGIYGYVFPSKDSPGTTPKHTATLQRAFVNGSKAARLGFRLDGPGFPSAGFGLMLEDALPQDLRGLVSLEATVHADRRRQVRVALMGPDSALKVAADTGLTFGRDTVVGTTPVRWSIPLSDLAWPGWATDLPNISREVLLSRIFAVQFQVVCEGKLGVCDQDSGWLVVDDLRLVGIGGGWSAPKVGDCSGPVVPIDAFASGNPRQNDLGGWWYAYTDRSSTDSAARGASRILNASVPESAQTWEGPSASLGHAKLRFELKRRGIYSGYAALETQLAPPELDTPRPADFPRSRSLAFTVGFEKDFPEGLGGIITHLRKAGRDFDNGADHQVRIPWDSTPRRWCLDLDALRQPSWSAWIAPFTPTNLLALSFEVKLPASIPLASGGFTVADIAFHLEPGAGVAPREPAAARPSLQRSASGLHVVLGRSAPMPIRWTLLQPGGSIVSQGEAPVGSRQIDLPDVGNSLTYLSVQEGNRTWSLVVPRRF